MQHTTRRRVLGSFYTPDWIARWMVGRALSTCDQSAKEFSWRILDPACGDGAFVLPVLDWIANRLEVSPSDQLRRMAIVRDHVFGVDADPPAIQSLHQRVAEWIGGDHRYEAEIAKILTTNFPCGNALLGADLFSDQIPSVREGVPDHQVSNGAVAPINWSIAFPQVAAAGGFDLVIGNPPYRRERNSKADFDQIANSAIGQRWRTARTDLWHYFFHRGMDLLKPSGRLSLIVNSYWTSSTAARSVRERLISEACLEELVFFGSARLFRNVSGRHMIFQIRKNHDMHARCRVLDLSDESRDQIEAVLSHRDSAATIVSKGALPFPSMAQVDLWSSGGHLRVGSESRHVEATHEGPRLEEIYEVRQGMAENPPFVTRSAAAELGDPSLTGRGVFVLTSDEVEALKLDQCELLLLRPYYALSTVGRFRVAPVPSHQVLYLTRLTAPALDDFPRVAAHLERFRGVLQRRREVQSGQIAWWHLHWPREERLFNSQRVLCLQMGPEPRFAFAEPPTYVGFSMHVIVDRMKCQTASPSLAALAAILNSSFARKWFETHAKRRGVHLDISGTVLKQFPLPSAWNSQTDVELAQLTRTWSATSESEDHLNRLVNAIYATAVRPQSP